MYPPIEASFYKVCRLFKVAPLLLPQQIFSGKLWWHVAEDRLTQADLCAKRVNCDREIKKGLLQKLYLNYHKFNQTLSAMAQSNPDFASMTDGGLIDLRIKLDKEFKQRGIKFSVGEIGEQIAIDFFSKTPGLSNLQRAPTGTKNVDALSRGGERYSIKTIKEGSKTGTVYPDPEDGEKQLFEFLLLVQLNDDYQLQSIHRFSWKQFLKVRQWDKTMNAWYIPKTLKALSTSEDIYGNKQPTAKNN